MTHHSFTVTLEQMFQQICELVYPALDGLVGSPPGPPALLGRLPGPSLDGWSPLPGASLPTQCRRRLHWDSPRAGGVVGGGSPCVFARAAGPAGPLPSARRAAGLVAAPPPGLVARRLVGVGGPCCPPALAAAWGRASRASLAGVGRPAGPPLGRARPPCPGLVSGRGPARRVGGSGPRRAPSLMACPSIGGTTTVPGQRQGQSERRHRRRP